MSLDWMAGAGRPLQGELLLPGDKSVSHRAVMLAAIAEGSSRISGFLEGEDTRATARSLARLGVRISAPTESERLVEGVGLHGLRRADGPLDCGNAGTGMRLLMGLLAGQAFDSVLIGDASLSRRPMQRVIAPLAAMGACIESEPGGLPPIRINISNGLQGIDYEMPVASAQVKSAILLAGLLAQGTTSVREAQPTRDYTERMLAAFGWPIRFGAGFARIEGGHRLHATEVAVPTDFSSAAFFMVAASIVPGSDLWLRRVGMNPRRTGLLQALRMMGADIEVGARQEQGGEPVADLRIRSARLRGIALPASLVPDMIDEFPVLMAAAAVAEGETRISGAEELRVKESDRLASMAGALRAMGADVEEYPDGARIRGGRLRGAEVDSLGDHRVAMSLAVAAQRSDGEVRIRDCDNVATSFPGFLELAADCGFGLRQPPAG